MNRYLFTAFIFSIRIWPTDTMISKSHTMMPKTRGLVQHGGPPGWLEESDPAGCDFVRDGRSMPDHTTCPGLSGALYYKMYTKHRQELHHAKGDMAWYSSRPMPSLWSHTIIFLSFYILNIHLILGRYAK
jgi:hypothetical protein